MKKKIISLILCTLIFATYFSVATAKTNDSTNPTNSPIDDVWPMFHHDITHSGFSSSKAPNTNKTLWIQSTSAGGITSSPAVVNDKVYIGAVDGKIHCFDAKTGVEKWVFQTENWVTSSPAVSNGKVYVGSWDGNIYCIDATNGHFIWAYQTAGGMFNWIVSSPSVLSGKVYVGAWNGKVYCLDANGNGDGTTDLIWTYQTDDSVESSPAVSDGRVYVGSDDGYMYCLDANGNGYGSTTVLWKYDTGYYHYYASSTPEGDVPPFHISSWIWSSPAVANGRVYFSEGRGTVYCLNASTGVKIWSDATGEWGSPSSPAVADGRVYIGTYYEPDYHPRYGTLYCYDANTGRHLWNYTTGNFLLSSPAVADKKVYVGSFDNNTYCLDERTGALIWKYTTDGVIRTSPAIAYGRVYIACWHDLPDYHSYGKIYCFEDQ